MHHLQAPALLQLSSSDTLIDIEPSADVLCIAWNQTTLMDHASSQAHAEIGKSDTEADRETKPVRFVPADRLDDEDDEKGGLKEEGVELALLVSSSLLTTAGSMSDADDLV